MVNCLVCLTEGPTPVTSSSASAFSAPSGEFLDLDKFKKPEGSWDWETCLVQNKAEATKCVACESAKPSTKAELKECSGAESAAASQFILGRTEEKQDSVTTAAPLKAELQRYQSYNYNDYCQDYQNYHSQRSYDAYADYNYSSYAPYDSMQAVGDCSLGDSLMAPAVFEESSVMTAIGDDLITDGNKGSIIVT
ncbi:uncharacterized protein [Anser cygnoides]|uniref:uncharacterized protein isoform X3 n=1 Tax=Anser cygnoides TaxID=8845 RepID=UPI0034D35721